jgi:hypothetical protein
LIRLPWAGFGARKVEPHASPFASSIALSTRFRHRVLHPSFARFREALIKPGIGCDIRSGGYVVIQCELSNLDA